MKTATTVVINSREGQTVNLPEGFHLDASEVYVKRMGRAVLLIPKDANLWDTFEKNLDLVTEDFMRDCN